MAETPTLFDLLSASIDNKLKNVHVCLPGKIEKYHGNQKADVKPLIMDGSDALPVITNVPVVFPRSGGASLTFPVRKGDGVLLVFSERSLDVWLSKGGDVDPQDPRTHDLTDAIAIPGLIPLSEGSASGDDVVLAYNNTKITLNKSGKLAIGNQAAELLDLFEQTLSAIEIATVGPTGGPLLNAASFTAIKTLLAQIKGTL